jgi:hypothetical protein
MPHRIGIILLAAAVFAANAYCACTTGAGPSSSCHIAAAEGPERRPCHGHGGTDPSSAPDRHDCGHCNGNWSLDAPGQKSFPPGAFLSALVWAEAHPAGLVTEVVPGGHVIDHSGASPPGPAPTLLNLSCSFNN